MKENFRNIVSQSHQSIISRVLQAEGLILEAGAGPTVQQAITNPNPALLSMVIQMSLLASSHEQQSLAQAITTVSSDSRTSGDATQEFDYVSVLGVITACQQQTAQFPWASFFDSTEAKIFDAIENGQHHNAKKRRRSSAAKQDALTRAPNRCLPFVILKALFMNLVSIQDFPEHRNLYLHTDSGFSTIVIWCYHVLGISVSVQIKGVSVQFGDEPRIFVEESKPLQAFASMLDVAEVSEPLFKLSQVEEDPPIQSEDRVAARGFARRILTLSGVSEANIDTMAHWIAAECINFVSLTPSTHELTPLKVTSMDSQVAYNIRESMAFLFDLAQLDIGLLKKTGQKRKWISGNQTKWVRIMLLMISFARVHNLKSCENLPLSLTAFWDLSKKDFGASFIRGEFVGKIPDTLVCFDIISRLILGHQYSKEYVSNSVLISSWGWCVFLDSFDALDPENIRPGLIHVRLGVPSRKGERKMRIVDGPTEVPIVYGNLLDDSEIPITFWPGVFAGKLNATLIGYYGHDAFSIVQIYEWQMGQKLMKWRLGFRDKHEICLKFTILEQCPCPDYLKDEESQAWIDKLIAEGLLQRRDNVDNADFVVTAMYPSSEETISSSPERVFCTAVKMPNTTDSSSRAWFFYVTVISVARASSSSSDPATLHGKVINVESQQAFKELTASGPVVVDFFATWCGPCKAIAPKVGEFSETYTNVRFLQVDVDKQQQIARDLGVTAMPTFILFKNGKPLPDRIRGANVRALENAIKQIA
ncbi:hypothetical protein ZTR_03472 [Talaromyces verruculosus]|nr:hypothetical protein ZTR_03472 [Talaromyces verruculosus]